MQAVFQNGDLYCLLTSQVLAQSPLHYSNVMLADPVTGRPVRVGWRYLEDGTKVSATYHLLMTVLAAPACNFIEHSQSSAVRPEAVHSRG